MAEHPIQIIRSDKDDHFTEAITANNKEDEHLSMPERISSRGYITGVQVISKENLVWRLYFWAKDTTDNADPDVDTFLHRFDFAAADGVQIGATGLYRYTKTDLKIPYGDTDSHSYEIHVSLGIASGSAKTATTDGEVVVVVSYRPHR